MALPEEAQFNRFLIDTIQGKCGPPMANRSFGNLMLLNRDAVADWVSGAREDKVGYPPLSLEDRRRHETAAVATYRESVQICKLTPSTAMLGVTQRGQPRDVCSVIRISWIK